MNPIAAAGLGIVVVVGVLLDAFEVVLLPRPVRRRIQLNHYFFITTWRIWAFAAKRYPPGRRRENFISIYGPLSMVLLFAFWALCLIVGFGLIQWSLTQGDESPFGRELIISGDAFFTLGYGDIVPRNALARVLVILEAGTGFGFIALTVSYLPILYQHFSRRDAQLIEMGARAGTPPCAAQLLVWHAANGDLARLDQWLRDWERWAGDLIESHSTYPMLAFYRSQHEGHSWLASLTVILDASAILIACAESRQYLQAAATFTAARRVLLEMTNSLSVSVPQTGSRRFDPGKFSALGTALQDSSLRWRDDPDLLDSICKIRLTYEPQLAGLSAYLLLPLPEWVDDAFDWKSLGRGLLIKRLAAKRMRPD